MNKELYRKIAKLPIKDKIDFNKTLLGILNDRYSCYIYGIEVKEYANPPREKIERVKEILYYEMFEKINPPRKLSSDFSFNLN